MVMADIISTVSSYIILKQIYRRKTYIDVKGAVQQFMKKVRRFMINALIMAGVAILMRTIGVSYNVWLSNKIGAECMGLYSLVMSVYSFAVTLACSGVNLAAVRLTAENGSHGKNVMGKCILYAALFGFGTGILIFLSADFIGNNIFNDVRTINSLRAFSFSLPAIALSSALNGYFNGVRRVYKSAFVQVTEQFLRIGFISYLVLLFLPDGIESACYAVVLGGVISEILSFAVIFTLYIFDKKIHFGNMSLPQFVQASPSRLSDVSKIALPVAIGSYARSALVTIEHIAIPWGLKRCGISPEIALASYGILHGMVFPLIFFPSAVLGAFAGLLIPEIAESHACGDNKRICYIANRVFSVSLIFSIGVSAVFISFGGQFGESLYSGIEAGVYIRLIAPLIPVMYLDSAVDAMLKGLGEQVHSMKINIADAAVSVLLVLILVPQMGIYGYIITVFVCEIMNGALSICRLIKSTSVTARPLEWLIKPALCAFCAMGGGKLLMLMFGGSYILWIVVSAAGYIILILFSEVISKSDVKWAVNIFRS